MLNKLVGEFPRNTKGIYDRPRTKHTTPGTARDSFVMIRRCTVGFGVQLGLRVWGLGFTEHLKACLRQHPACQECDI